jgi:hypothetical protein
VNRRRRRRRRHALTARRRRGRPAAPAAARTSLASVGEKATVLLFSVKKRSSVGGTHLVIRVGSRRWQVLDS